MIPRWNRIRTALFLNLVRRGLLKRQSKLNWKKKHKPWWVFLGLIWADDESLTHWTLRLDSISILSKDLISPNHYYVVFVPFGSVFLNGCVFRIFFWQMVYIKSDRFFAQFATLSQVIHEADASLQEAEAALVEAERKRSLLRSMFLCRF